MLDPLVDPLFADGARRRAYVARVRALGPIGYWPLSDAVGSIQARNLGNLSGELVYNGDFEHATDFFGWSRSQPDGSVTMEAALTHGGVKAARATCGASGNTYLDQGINLTSGESYTLRFWTRGDGTRGGGYDIWDLTNAAYIAGPRIATAVTGEAYAQVSRAFTVPANCKKVRVRFYCPSFNTAFAFFDDVSIQGPGPNAPALNATFGEVGIGDGKTAASVAGTGAVDIFSGLLAGAWSGDEGTASIWLAVGAAATWTDGTQDVALEVLGSAGTGALHIAKSSVARIIQCTRVVSGGTVTLNFTEVSDTLWHHCVFAWSKSAGECYAALDGDELAPVAYPGDWVGSLVPTSVCVGAYDNTGATQGFRGKLAHAAIWNRCLDATARKALARK